MKKIIIILISSILLIFILFNLLAVLVLGRKTNKNTIIKKYNKNIEAFEKCIEELTENKIYFDRENLRFGKGKIIITIHEDLEDDTVNVVTVSESEYSKYKNTINLMEKLNIDCVHKTEKNTLFQFNSMIGFSQEIVKIEDEEHYIWCSGEPLYKESLGNDWYYIEHD